MTEKIAAYQGKPGIPSLPQVSNIIAVASGKGGVGKSTIALNLSLALKASGATVGLLDADIYGPSQPTMLNAQHEKAVVQNKKLQPISRFGLQTMSIGYLVNGTVPLAWRGPMLGKALEQLACDTAWQGLDYLIIDLPPGTGDIQLTLCQKIPVTGAVVVTTPQDIALIDVQRACEMFQKLGVPMLGIVENMSGHQCAHCGHLEAIFGEGGASKLAAAYQLPVLASIPLDVNIRTLTDSGQAAKMHAEQQTVSNLFAALALKVKAQLATRPKNYSAKFPKIVVENKVDEGAGR